MNYHAAREFKANDRITEDDALEAAHRFLACVFGDNSVLADCGLDAEDFADSLHQKIFTEAQRLYQSHQHINAVSMKPHIPKQIATLDITPAEYLHQLTMLGTDPVTRMQMEGDVQVIKSVSLARGLAREAQFAAEMAAEGHSLLTLDEEIEALEQRLKERRTRLAALKAGTSPGTAYLNLFAASSQSQGIVGVPIALPEIAKALSEPVFEAGNLYGLLSSSGEGKTSLTNQIITHAVKSGHPVEFFSYDQSAAQCVRQMIAQEKGIDIRQQRDPSKLMTQREQDECVQFAVWLDKQPLEIVRCQREGVAQLVAYARRFIKKHANGKTPLIVLDHIGKVKARDPRLSPDRISGEVTVELKALADETQSAVLVLNQRNSEGTKRINPRPISRDLYGGEGAKQDYDAVAYLYRPSKYQKDMLAVVADDRERAKINAVFAEFGSEIDTVAEVGVIKCRFGDPSIRETLKFEARYTRYVSTRPAVAQERMI